MADISKRLVATVLTFVALASFQAANSQDSHSEILTKYMTPDVVGVFYINLDELDLDATVQNARKLGFRESDELADLMEAMSMIKSELKELDQVGISRAYALFRLDDVQSRGTSWVVPLRPGSDPAAAKRAFSNLAAKLVSNSSLKHSPMKLFTEIEATTDAVLVSATKSQMERLENVQLEQPESQAAMWDAMGNGTAGVVVFGDDHSRRVIGELLPNLPAPFESITGKLIAEGIDWVGIELTLGKLPGLKIEFETRTEQVAMAIEQGLVKGEGVLRQLAETGRYLSAGEAGFVFDAVKPVRRGNRVTISVEKLTAEWDRFSRLLAPQAQRARREAGNMQRINLLRQSTLAIHNFESAYKHFPTQATVGEDGKPLLSWRVQILPFLGQIKLYDKFHHNEPWDSEHNLKLVQQMPDLFADPNPLSRENNKAGKTIYQGAAGKGMMFDGSNEIGVSDIKDGSSNTIMLVAVAREHAVPWTQPVDWQVNLDDPTAGLVEDSRDKVEFSLMDGSIQRYPISTSAANWRRLFQIADGEVVDR